jgi:ribosomal protein S18
LIHLDEDLATGFIETFIVPALRSLEIPEQYLDADPIESLKRFISKSGCKLEELRITGQRTRPQHSYRQAFPWIRNFSFNGERTDEQGPSDVEASS